MTRRLHEIGSDFLALEELLLETGGEWTPEVEALVNELDHDLEAKTDAYAALIREWLYDAEKWRAEEERVAAHRKALENSAARLKTRLCEELVRIGRDTVEGPRFRVAVQYGPPTVEVLVPAERLPEAYRREVPATCAADKKALADALKAGAPELDQLAALRFGAPYLRIR